MTEGLAEKLKALREKATPGPWDLRSYQSGSVNVVMREWPAPNEYGQGALFASMTTFNIGEQDANEIGREKFYNADLIRTLVNNLDTIISALSGDGMEWRPKSDMPGWTRVTDRLPAYGEGLRVVIYTEGYDFAGEQFFHIAADALTECGFEDMPSSKDREVAARASHWIPDDELMAMIAASPALTNDKEG